jgi:hypothetical protein
MSVSACKKNPSVRCILGPRPRPRRPAVSAASAQQYGNSIAPYLSRFACLAVRCPGRRASGDFRPQHEPGMTHCCSPARRISCWPPAHFRRPAGPRPSG